MTDAILLFSNIAAGSLRAAFYLYLTSRLLSKKPGQRVKPLHSARPQTGSRRKQAPFPLADCIAQGTLGRGTVPASGGMALCAAIAIMGIAAISALLYVTGLPDFYRVLFETVWLVICAGRLQGTNLRMGLFVGIFYEIAVSFWQFLIAAWVGVLLHSPAFLDFGKAGGQMAVWLLHMLLAALWLTLWKHPDTAEKETFRFLSAAAVAGFIAVITLSQQTVLPIADDTLDMWTVLAVVLMMSVLVFHMNRQYEMEKELALLKSEQAQLLERDYTSLSHAYEINAKLFHDFHNHMGVLRRLLSRQKTEEAIRYLDELQAPVQEMADTLWTGDETVDYLINSKAQAAKANKIQYTAQVEFPRRTNLQSADLCAILGNLLDNALEAAGQAPEKERRFVRLTIRRIHQMLVIKVENGFTAPPAVKDGELKTSKEENGLHGWGLKSARTAAEKYDGTVQTSYTDDTFRAVATLSFQGVPVE